jgi:hypothetical protein
MKSIIRLLVCLWAFQALMATPIIQLTPVYHLDLPTAQHPGGSIWWDVQHWADDSTYGWAYVQNDSVHYALHDGDMPTVWRNDTLFSGYPTGYRNLLGVRLVRLPSANSPIGLIIVGESVTETYGETDWIIGVFNLETDAMIGRFNGTASQQENYYGSSAEITKLFPYPPPPLPAQQIIAVTHWHHWNYWDPHNAVFDDDYYLNAARVRSNGLDSTHTYNCTYIEPFPDLDSCRIAFYYTASQTQEYNGTVTWYRVGTANLSAQSVHIDSSGWPRIYWAQGDGDGTRRIIFHGHSGLTALNPATFDTLWHNWRIPDGDLAIARLAGSENERILQYYSSGRFYSIYDASNSDSLGITSSITGRPLAWMKCPGREAELIAFDDSQGRLSVYRSYPTGVTGLTFALDLSGEILHLRWPWAIAASGYRIYTGSSVAGPFTLLAEVSGNVNSFDITPQDSQKYFFVTTIANGE